MVRPLQIGAPPWQSMRPMEKQEVRQVCSDRHETCTLIFQLFEIVWYGWVGRFLDDVTSSGHHTTKINRFVCVREASPPLFLFRCFLLNADIQRVCFRLSRLLFSDDFSSFRMRFSGFHFLSTVQIIKRCGFVVYPTNGRPPRTNQCRRLAMLI